MLFASGASSLSGRSAHWPLNNVTDLVMAVFSALNEKEPRPAPRQTGSAGAGLRFDSERRVRHVILLGVFLGDQDRRNDRLCGHLSTLDARCGSELHGVGDHAGRIGDIGRNDLVAVHDFLDVVLRTSATQDKFDVGALGLLDGFLDAYRHVIVGSPDRINVFEAGQVVLHDLERIVPVPVAMFGVKYLDARIGLHDGVERVHTLVVNHGRYAAQNHYVALSTHRLDHVFSGNLAKTGVVTGNVSILGFDTNQATVDHRNEHGLTLDLWDR